MYTDVYRRVHCCRHTCIHLRSRYVPTERDIDLAKALAISAIRTSTEGAKPTRCEGLSRLIPVRRVSHLLGGLGRCREEYLVEREIKCTFALANSSKRVHVEAP